jgi:putative transposase
MARKLREQVAGGVYHVYARGNKKADIYLDDADRWAYLRLLGRVVTRREWRLMAYCLMANHVHFLVETPEADIGAGMQWFHGNYARTFNERHAEAGHVFQGRYGSTLVAGDEQLVTVVGYIAHNPVKAGLVGEAGAWAWSSHAATVGRVARPAWLDVPRLLELLGGWGGDPAIRYREIVGARGGGGEGTRARGATVSTSLVNVGGGGPPRAPAASVVRKR